MKFWVAIFSFVVVLALSLGLSPGSLSNRAEARSSGTCANLFVVKDVGHRHLLPAQEFYRSPIDPDTMKLDGLIVVTEPLLRKLTSEPTKDLRAYLVLDLNGFTQNRFVSLMAQHYQMTASFKTEFTTGFQNVEVRGSSESLLRFLGNAYAKRSVLWAGQQQGVKYIDHILGFFNESGPDTGSDAWSNKGADMHRNGGRSYLEPMRPDGRKRSRGFEENRRSRGENDFSDLF